MFSMMFTVFWAAENVRRPMITNRWPWRLMVSLRTRNLTERLDKAGVAAAVETHVDDQAG